jgi:hypothetical protein
MSLTTRILDFLAEAPADCETIAGCFKTSRNQIGARLSELKRKGLVASWPVPTPYGTRPAHRPWQVYELARTKAA